MSLKSLVRWSLLTVLLGACAGPSPSERPVAVLPQVLFQSPIALLLERHDALALTTDQMIQLGQREEILAAKNRPLHDRLREISSPRPPPRRNPPGVGTRGDPGPSAWPAEPPPPEGEEAAKQRQALLRTVEDNENAAWKDVEPLLDEQQQAKARELFARQREERLQANESLRGPGACQPGHSCGEAGAQK